MLKFGRIERTSNQVFEAIFGLIDQKWLSLKREIASLARVLQMLVLWDRLPAECLRLKTYDKANLPSLDSESMPLSDMLTFYEGLVEPEQRTEETSHGQEIPILNDQELESPAQSHHQDPYSTDLSRAEVPEPCARRFASQGRAHHLPAQNGPQNAHGVCSNSKDNQSLSNATGMTQVTCGVPTPMRPVASRSNTSIAADNPVQEDSAPHAMRAYETLPIDSRWAKSGV